MSDDLCGSVRRWREHSGVCHRGGGAPAGKPLYPHNFSQVDQQSPMLKKLLEVMQEVAKSVGKEQLSDFSSAQLCTWSDGVFCPC